MNLRSRLGDCFSAIMQSIKEKVFEKVAVLGWGAWKTGEFEIRTVGLGPVVPDNHSLQDLQCWPVFAITQAKFAIGVVSAWFIIFD